MCYFYFHFQNTNDQLKEDVLPSILVRHVIKHFIKAFELYNSILLNYFLNLD